MKFDTSIPNLFMIIINLLLQKMHRLIILVLSLLFATKFGSSKLEKCWACTGFGGTCESKAKYILRRPHLFGSSSTSNLTLICDKR